MNYMRTSDYRSQLEQSISAERERNSRLKSRVEQLEAQVSCLQTTTVPLLNKRLSEVSLRSLSTNYSISNFSAICRPDS